MKSLIVSLPMGALLAASAMIAPAPAIAQAGTRSVTIYGNDPCPADAICVRAPESQRYRLPKDLNPQGTRQQRESWARKSQSLKTVGATGIGSCSAVGPGGFTGCLTQEIKQARRETSEQNGQDQPPE